MIKREVHMPRDWSHEEQLAHIRSCPMPNEKQPFDWFGFWFSLVVVMATTGFVVSCIWWLYA